MAKIRKLYKDYTEIPDAEFEVVVLLLCEGNKKEAEKALRTLLLHVKDLAHYEAFHIAQSLMRIANSRVQQINV